ncbi:MAG TPA: PA domain-containing protein [Acidimicrobiia bacterium]|nr:PA domain-containing protein [Acidimicrobiia bacterium]
MSRRVITFLMVSALLMVVGAGPSLAKPSGSGPGNSPNAKICKDWDDLYTSTGGTFASKEACVSYAANGGTILTEDPLNAFQRECVNQEGTNETPELVDDRWGEGTRYRCRGFTDLESTGFEAFRAACEETLHGYQFGWIPTPNAVTYCTVGIPTFYQVVVDAPSSAAGNYVATIAQYGPALNTTGISGQLVVVSDGSPSPSLGCGPLVGFPAGQIAVIDRGVCQFADKLLNAQNAGASAVIIVNNVAAPPIIIPCVVDCNLVTIPSVMISQADGATIKAGLPAGGTLRRVP